MWHWKNNGSRPPIDPYDCLIAMTGIFMVYFGGIALCGMLYNFVLAILEWQHPTGRFRF